MARKIVITSGKGGVGKTTICANLGAKLACFGFRVLLIDADIGLNNLDVVAGVENKVCFDLTDVIEARCRPKQALIQDENYNGLYILPSSKAYNKSFCQGDNIKNVVEQLASSFDYILIDCPAGVEMGFQRAVYAADEAIIVVTPHISSIRDADKVLSILSTFNLTSKYLVLNRVRGDLLLSGEMFNVEEIVGFLKVPVLGVIPEDDDLAYRSSLGKFRTGSVGNRAFDLLCENLHDGTHKIYDCAIKYKGFFGAIRRSLKRKV